MLNSQYVDFSNPNADKITSASTTSIKEEAKRRAKNYMRLKDGYVEPKQETLEESAERTYQKGLQDDIDLSFYDGVRLGSKWQSERMYSEEEVKDMLFAIIDEGKQEECCITHTRDSIVRKIFEQFKKK
jgi:hypothetical protein